MFKIISNTVEQTMDIGTQLGTILKPGDLLNLNGTLGAGKTLLVKGIGRGLNISEDLVTSPTFSIINEYEGKHPLYHFDLYRLENALDLEQVGYLDYFYGSGITCVEWGELFSDYLPQERLDIVLNQIGINERELIFQGLGKRGQEIEAQLGRLL